MTFKNLVFVFRDAENIQIPQNMGKDIFTTAILSPTAYKRK
jgi:hypothetical protein